jgi:signal transduction histidine kinase
MRLPGVTARDMIRILTRPMIMWAAPVARILMSMTVIDSLYGQGRPLTHWFVLMWAAWAAVTTAATAIGHHFRVQELQAIAAIDAAIGALSIFLMPGSEAPAIAFLICSAVMILGCGVGPLSLSVLFTLPLLAWSAGEVWDLIQPAGHYIVQLDGTGVNGLVAVMQLGALAAVAALIHRKARIDIFTRECNSIEMLRPDRSFEFDLQEMVDNLARIFAPERAFCVISRAAKNAGYRQFSHNCDLAKIATDIPAMLDVAEMLPERASIYDTEESACWPLDADRPRSLSEAEQHFAQYLKREHFVVALVQPLQIGRASGILVCASTKPIDACLFVDALKIEKNIAALMTFLARMADAERQFIADAHDVARRDLHDGVLQSMAALRMKLLTIAKREDLKTHAAHLELRKAADILTLEQVRLRGLLETSASENDTINLVARLDICLRAISLQWEIDAKIESNEPAVPVDRESALNIEHLVREAVANAVRHAKISALTVMLSLKHDALLIAINDRGGSEQSAQKRGSMPLQSASLQHRLRLVNGTAYSEGLGQGALLAISIPMQQVEDA